MPDQRNSKLFAVTIEENPKIIGNSEKLSQEDIIKVKVYVRINKEVLLDYWLQMELDLRKIFERLKKYTN